MSLAVPDLVDATPSSRDRCVDALRALAVVVVVAWHWVFSVTHWTADGRLTMPNPVGDVPGLWLATWLLQVMPLFFVVGGYANLAAWDAATRRGDGAGAFLRSRLRRLGRPVAVFLACWAAVELVMYTLLPGYRGVWEYGRVVFVPLWFLGVYAAVVALVPLTARLHARYRELVPVALGGAVVVADAGRLAGGVDELGLVSSGLVWVFAHQLGYWWRDGSLVAGGRRRALTLALGGLAALVGLTSLGPYPRSMVAVRGEGASNLLPTTACVAALAVFQLGVVLLVRPALARWLARRRPWSVVVAVNGVAMTVFTWHMTALLAAVLVVQGSGFELGSQPTASWWTSRPVWLLLPGVFLAGLVALFSRVERR